MRSSDAVFLCPQVYNNLLPGSVSSQLDYYTLKVTAVVSVTLTATNIQGADLSEPLVLLALPSRRCLEQTRDSNPQLALIHPKHAKPSLSYLNHLKIDAPGFPARVVATTCYVCSGVLYHSRSYLNQFSLFA